MRAAALSAQPMMQAVPVVGKAGVAAPIRAGVLFPEGVHRVADRTPERFCQPVREGLTLESPDILRVEILAQQVVGLHPVVVDQDDGGLPPLEESAQALGDEAAGSPAADHGDPRVVQQELVVQVVRHSITSLSFVWCVVFVHEPDARVRAAEHLGPVQRGEVAVDADPQAQLGPVAVEASHDAVDAEALLVPVVGGREEGAGASVGVELGDHPSGGQVRESRCGPRLRGNHQPVAVPVPAHGEEPLGVRFVLEPAQPQLEELCRNRAVGELQLLGNGSEPANRAGGDQDPRRQVRALGLDVDAPDPST